MYTKIVGPRFAIVYSKILYYSPYSRTFLYLKVLMTKTMMMMIMTMMKMMIIHTHSYRGTCAC